MAAEIRVYLFRLCRLPPMYSGRLNEAVLRILPYAMLLHMAIGCWVYSAQNQVRLMCCVRSDVLNKWCSPVS
jgi:hypothetical protein